MNAYYNENEPFAAAWLRGLIAQGLIAPGYVDERDIRDVKPADLAGYEQCHFFAGIGGWSYALRLAGWPDGRPVWTGSCPCQPWSSATRGKGQGRQDGRDLWPVWRALIFAASPGTVFGEQVAHGSSWIDRMCDDLEAMDYQVGAAILPAVSVGKDHIRNRIYFVGYADGNGEPSLPVNAEMAGLQRTGSNSESMVRANGLPEILAGFGNAIVPQVAAEFIGAYLDVVAE